MAVRVKVSAKNRIAVPAVVRKQLQIKSGDRLLAEVRACYVILMPEPRDDSKHLRGLHREIWQDVESEEYVRRERDAWKDLPVV